MFVDEGQNIVPKESTFPISYTENPRYLFECERDRKDMVCFSESVFLNIFVFTFFFIRSL